MAVSTDSGSSIAEQILLENNKYGVEAVPSQPTGKQPHIPLLQSLHN